MTNHNRRNSDGFSLIEILIVIVAVGVLVAIVVNTFAGIQARSRNSQRTDDLKTLQEHIESFFAHNMYYPSLSDMNNPSWLKANMKGVSTSMYADPSWTPHNTKCTLNGHPILLKKSEPGCFGYDPSNNGASCESSDTTCDDYTLSASLEQGAGTYDLSQLD